MGGDSAGTRGLVWEIDKVVSPIPNVALMHWTNGPFSSPPIDLYCIFLSVDLHEPRVSENSKGGIFW